MIQSNRQYLMIHHLVFTYKCLSNYFNLQVTCLQLSYHKCSLGETHVSWGSRGGLVRSNPCSGLMPHPQSVWNPLYHADHLEITKNEEKHFKDKYSGLTWQNYSISTDCSWSNSKQCMQMVVLKKVSVAKFFFVACFAHLTVLKPPFGNPGSALSCWQW